MGHLLELIDLAANNSTDVNKINAILKDLRANAQGLTDEIKAILKQKFIIFLVRHERLIIKVKNLSVIRLWIRDMEE